MGSSASLMSLAEPGMRDGKVVFEAKALHGYSQPSAR
jgi:hypothetical protein